MLWRQVIQAYSKSGFDDCITAYSPVFYYKNDETSGVAAIEEIGGNDGVYSSGYTLNQPSPHANSAVGVQCNGLNNLITNNAIISLVSIPNFSVNLTFKPETPTITNSNLFNYKNGGTELKLGFDGGTDITKFVFTDDFLAPATSNKNLMIDLTHYLNTLVNLTCVVTNATPQGDLRANCMYILNGWRVLAHRGIAPNATQTIVNGEISRDFKGLIDGEAFFDKDLSHTENESINAWVLGNNNDCNNPSLPYQHIFDIGFDFVFLCEDLFQNNADARTNAYFYNYSPAQPTIQLNPSNPMNSGTNSVASLKNYGVTATSFDTVNTIYMTGNNNYFDGNPDITVSIMIKAPILHPNANQIKLFEIKDSKILSVYWESTTPKIVVTITSLFTLNYPTVTPFDNTIHCVQFVKNGADYSVYLDGVLLSTQTNASNPNFNGQKFGIGNFGSGNWNGDGVIIDEYLIHRGVKTKAQLDIIRLNH